MNLGPHTSLGQLRDGALFVTTSEDGESVYAVKSEYRYTNDPGSQCQCVLLASGEYAHFAWKNEQTVREVLGPWGEDGLTMHTLTTNGVVFNFNGDFSGKVRIVDGGDAIEVPCQALLEFAAEYVRQKRLREAERAGVDDLLKG